MNKKTKKFLWTIVIVLIIGGGIWLIVSIPPTPEQEIISKQGIHWHTELSISILGEKQDIPADIGIGAVHNPIHTHDTDGVIHMEFSGLVRKDDVKIEQFFKIWKKEFNKDCIFDKCNGVKMLVNGEVNQEFENYIMKNKDKIEIIFEEKKETLFEQPAGEVKEFDMTAKKWEFSPNTITVNKGDTVILHIKSIDVNHGFAFPSGFNDINVTLRPGETVDVEFVADQEGTFMFVCSIICGSGHSRMIGQLIVK